MGRVVGKVIYGLWSYDRARIRRLKMEDLSPDKWARCVWAVFLFLALNACVMPGVGAAVLAPRSGASEQKLITPYFQTHFLFKPLLGFLLLEAKTWTLPFYNPFSPSAMLSCPKLCVYP